MEDNITKYFDGEIKKVENDIEGLMKGMWASVHPPHLSPAYTTDGIYSVAVFIEMQMKKVHELNDKKAILLQAKFSYIYSQKEKKA